MSSKNFNEKKTLYCESYKGKKAAADVRGGIKHST